MSAIVTVYCNHQSHRRKRVEVAEFGINQDGRVVLMLSKDMLEKKVEVVAARIAKTRVKWVGRGPVLPIRQEDSRWMNTGKTAVVCRLCRRRLEPSEALDAAIVQCSKASPDVAYSNIDMDELLGMIGN